MSIIRQITLAGFFTSDSTAEGNRMQDKPELVWPIKDGLQAWKVKLLILQNLFVN